MGLNRVKELLALAIEVEEPAGAIRRQSSAKRCERRHSPYAGEATGFTGSCGPDSLSGLGLDVGSLEIEGPISSRTRLQTQQRGFAAPPETLPGRPRATGHTMTSAAPPAADAFLSRRRRRRGAGRAGGIPNRRSAFIKASVLIESNAFTQSSASKCTRSFL